MKNDSMIQFVEKAADIATLAAAAYLNAHNKPIDIDKLIPHLRGAVKAEIMGALDDAKEAFVACGADVADATFRASMKLAGIHAAQAYEAAL